MRALPKPGTLLKCILSNVEDPVNVGSAFRTLDACKAQELILTGIAATPPHKLITKVGRGKDRRVPWRYEQDLSTALAAVKEEGYETYAIEITGDARPYYAETFPAKTCLLVGHEDHGLSKRALAEADHTIFLPMYGKGASLNVHVALSIVSYHVLHQPQS